MPEMHLKMGRLFAQGVQPSEIEKMNYSSMLYWWGFADAIYKANREVNK